MSEIPPALRAVLEEAQRHGSLGPGSIDVAVAHALQFFVGLEPEAGWRIVDLGSGSGLPGLPLALAHPATQWVLLDGWELRVDALVRAIRRLDLGDRVEAIHSRAEDAGRGALRARADVVVARSFGPPALTAECAAPLLRVGGHLIVSTVEGEERWPAAGVPELGLVPTPSDARQGARFAHFVRAGTMSDRVPRRPAAQRRSPLF